VVPAVSTELKPIETTRPKDRIAVTQLWGGPDRGTCLQLTQFTGEGSTQDYGFIQLTKEDAKELARRLNAWADRQQ
jgi:hypothetical protein